MTNTEHTDRAANVLIRPPKYARRTGLTYGRKGPWHLVATYGKAVCGVQLMSQVDRAAELPAGDTACPNCRRVAHRA